MNYYNYTKMYDPSSLGSHKKYTNALTKSRVDVCFVPMCPSTSVKFPTKLFLTGPCDPKRRKKWFLAASRYDKLSPKSIIRCCEDHFDLEKDVTNWIKFKIVGGKLFLKKHVVPHKFECQKGMVKMRVTSEPAITKRKSCEVLESIENAKDPLECSPTTLESPAVPNYGHYYTKTPNDCSVQALYPVKQLKQDHVSEHSVAVSPDQVATNEKTSPFIQHMYEFIHLSKSDSITGSMLESIIDECKPQKIELRNITISRIMAQPKLYIGIPLSSSDLIGLFKKYIKCELHYICLVLKKLWLNESFAILAEDFDLEKTTATRIFSTTCRKMAEVLKHLLIKPPKDLVYAMLPICFRNSYSDTYCIIDCLEIEIQVPSNAEHNYLTYSSNNKCNTLKYLVSSTPAGVINFVSEGFSGQISDLEMVKESGFMDILPPGACIMVNSGFKGIESVLVKQQFQLIRLLCDSSNTISSKSKKISHLRVHIQGVIRKLREFAILKPHACIDNFLISNLDNAVIICCALINLQSTLIQS